MTKYSIEYKRELTEEEMEIIRFLIQEEKPNLKNQIKDLKVIGRCGCGKCPTVMLGTSFDDDIIINESIIADYHGVDNNQNPIGVTLFGNNKITELEFYSIDGLIEPDIIEIPLINTLQKNK